MRYSFGRSLDGIGFWSKGGGDSEMGDERRSWEYEDMRVRHGDEFGCGL